MGARPAGGPGQDFNCTEGERFGGESVCKEAVGEDRRGGDERQMGLTDRRSRGQQELGVWRKWC